MRASSACLVAWLVLASAARAQPPFPPGQIVDRVTCAADPSQSYALVLPPGYTPDHPWPAIFAFDPGGRGRTPVERYQAAAARYGFIVAGSNNARNGSAETGRAVSAMTHDVMTRFNLNTQRVYFAGMSGGARVALAAALGTPGIAGVIASSAGYPDSQPRKTLPFPLFATAGTEDFNHIEIRQLDAALTTPHHVEIFAGGHTWLSSDLAVIAVQWMEIRAMQSGLLARDERELDEIFAARVAAIPPAATDSAAYLALQALVTDFDGLRDVSVYAARAAVLGKSAAVRAAIKRDREEDEREVDMLRRVFTAQAELGTEDRAVAFAELSATWKDLSKKASAPDDSRDRRIARRVMGSVTASPLPADPEYRALVNRYRSRPQRGN